MEGKVHTHTQKKKLYEYNKRFIDHECQCEEVILPHELTMIKLYPIPKFLKLLHHSKGVQIKTDQMHVNLDVGCFKALIKFSKF